MGPLESLSLLAKHLASVDNPCRENDRLQGPSGFGEPRAEIRRVTKSTRCNNRVTLRKKLSASQVGGVFSKTTVHVYACAMQNNWGDGCSLVLILSGSCRLRERPQNMEAAVDGSWLLESPSDLPQSFSFLKFVPPGESLFDFKQASPSHFTPIILFPALIITGNYGVGGHLAHNCSLENWNLPGTQ